MKADEQKMAAAAAAALRVREGMRLGLGTGSTAKLFVDAVGRLVADGMRIVAVPTSEATRRQAENLGIPLTTLDLEPELDLTVDGADEVGPRLALIKGGGGALLREKLVAAASREVLIVADGSKHVERLGAFPLPIEVVPFGFETIRRRVREALEAEAGQPIEAGLRRSPSGEPFVTDGGHWLLDARLGRIDAPERLAASLKAIVGVVEHGLFIGLAGAALIGTPDGVIELRPGDGTRHGT